MYTQNYWGKKRCWHKRYDTIEIILEYILEMRRCALSKFKFNFEDSNALTELRDLDKHFFSQSSNSVQLQPDLTMLFIPKKKEKHLAKEQNLNYLNRVR